jgi:Flp pilus assembly protein TadG
MPMQGRTVHRYWHMKHEGQAVVESVLLMPLFFLFVFGLMQIAQLGIATIVANYAASSVARKAASEQNFPTATLGVPISLDTKYIQKANAMMVAGMQMDGGLTACIDSDPGVPTANLLVTLRTKLRAWPFFGDVIHTALKSTYDVQGGGCGTAANPGGFGPFNFSGQAPYFFFVTGSAKVRLNYTQ